jgi:hypothetical protein
MKTAARLTIPSHAMGWGVIGLWAFTFLGARAFLDRELQARLDFAPWVRVVAALAPVVPTILFLWVVVEGIRSQDELIRRIHLEALAVAYPLAILLLMTLGLLELAIPLSPEDWSYRHVWSFLPLFYVLGLAFAWRRYR